jgi:hypothetical protein
MWLVAYTLNYYRNTPHERQSTSRYIATDICQLSLMWGIPTSIGGEVSMYDTRPHITYFVKLLRLSAGKYLWSSVTGYSYAIMFGINVSLLIAAILYTLWRLKWRTTDSQQPIPCNFLRDFFECDHVVQSVKTVVRKRPGNRRTYLVILFIAMALYTFQRGQCGLCYSTYI